MVGFRRNPIPWLSSTKATPFTDHHLRIRSRAGIESSWPKSIEFLRSFLHQYVGKITLFPVISLDTSRRESVPYSLRESRACATLPLLPWSVGWLGLILLPTVSLSFLTFSWLHHKAPRRFGHSRHILVETSWAPTATYHSFTFNPSSVSLL